MAIVDFSETGNETLPAGQYKMRVLGWQKGYSKNKGTPQVEIKLVVTEGEFSGKTCLERLVVTQNSGWKIAKFVSRCGVDAKTVKADTDSAVFEKIYNALIGRKVIVYLDVTQYGNNSLDYIQVGIEEQPEIVFTQQDDAPAFLQGQSGQSGSGAVNWNA